MYTYKSYLRHTGK